MTPDRVYDLLLWFVGLQLALNAWIVVFLFRLDKNIALIFLYLPKRIDDKIKPESLGG